MKKWGFLNFFLLSILICGCSSNPLDVDVSGVSVDLQMRRMDRDIFEASDQDLETVHANWLTHRSEFYHIYFQDVVALGDPYVPTAVSNLNRFTSDPAMGDVYQAIQEVHGDASQLEEALTEAFRHYKHHFPKRVVPKVVLTHGGFFTRAFETDSVLGICLDMYLGPEHAIVKQLSPDAFPNFFKATMRPEYIAVDAMREWTSSEFYDPDVYGKTFGSQIIYWGKVQYLIDAAMPSLADSTKIRYTSDQIAWCEANEWNIWKEVVDQQILHAQDEEEIIKWITEGPFTATLPKESPSRVGIWLGWQIVRDYMEKNPNVSLEELMQESNYQRILKNYKPDK